MAESCIILGGGGHARVVIECVRASGIMAIHGILDEDSARWGTEVLGVRILGGDELLPSLARQGVTHAVVGVASVGDTKTRRALYDKIAAARLLPLSVRHPSAVCSPTARIGAGTVLSPLAVVNAGASVGVNALVNTGAIIEHESVIGDHTHVATGARVCGGAALGLGVHVGAGATVLQRVRIGDGAVIGAGAVVISDVAARETMVGVPARPVRAAPPALAAGAVTR